MDAFEHVVSSILARDGYWTTMRFPVELTKEEKRRIGRPSSPRWELDLVAYRPCQNEVLVVECKSYLDSPGVRCADLCGESESTRYKLFKDDNLREVVFHRLGIQLEERGLCCPNPVVRFALAAGRIATDHDRKALKSLFSEKGWALFDEEWICSRLATYGDEKYANDVAMVVAKLLLRNPQFQSASRGKVQCEA